MRDFFINWAEKLVAVFVILLGLGFVLTGITMFFLPATVNGGVPGPIAGIMMIIIGIVYTILMGGVMYLFFGIYRNTQRTNQLLEGLLGK
ncbi:hypothetical protein RA27_22125 [Ruegeria sp. ANG-R]|uniref:hypothetical protein n=1 Tax=Ruegeria sp. ANG-R TaxID=1577903 RepID=UPI00057E3AF0|nr:hypothetical protein [Ruegeria sp. ANG-R]KIC36455.1 hypothetical protein RA27_22125 [Ruegeria sp. ANG-R]